jgi:hypothetical protein
LVALPTCRRTPRLWRERIDSCQNFDTRHDVLVPKIFLTIAARGPVSLIGREGMGIHGYRNREDLKMAIITREFGLAMKVQLGMSDKADAKHGTAYQPSPQE